MNIVDLNVERIGKIDMNDFDISKLGDLLGLNCTQEQINNVINKYPFLGDILEKLSSSSENLSYEQWIELLKSLSPVKDIFLKTLETDVEYSKSSVDAEISNNELIRKCIENGMVSQECADELAREASARANREQEHRHKNEDADRTLNRYLKWSILSLVAVFLVGSKFRK